jgi:hypothetical protein
VRGTKLASGNGTRGQQELVIEHARHGSELYKRDSNYKTEDYKRR